MSFTLEALKESKDRIGQIYPVVKDANGTILDGYHRKRADPNWKEVVLPITDELESLRVRVHLNDLRRKVPPKEKKKWVQTARAILKKRGLKGTQKEIAKTLNLSRTWVTKYDDEPTQPKNKDNEKMSRRDIFSNYNVLGFKSPERLVNDIKTSIIEALPNDIEKETIKTIESTISEVTDEINPFFYVAEGDTEQPDKEFYHGATPAFIIETLVERFKPSRVLDSMAGTGTTGYVCAKNNIPCDLYDLYPYEKFGVKEGDAEFIEPGYTYDLIFNHIPYLGMVQYGEDEEDLSNLKENEFFEKLGRIFHKNYSLLVEGGIYAVLVGDWRSGGQLRPITARTTMQGLENGFRLWDAAIKLTGEMRGKALQEFRAEKFGYFAQMYDTLLVFRRG